MDDKKQRVFGRIAANIPKELSRNTVKKIVDNSQIERAHQVLESKDVPEREKRRVRKMLERGAFNDEEEVVNEEVAAKIDDYNTKAVKKAIAAGELPDPASDPFVQKRLQRMKNKNGAAKVTARVLHPTFNRILVRPIDMAPKNFLITPSKRDKPVVTGIVVGVGPDVTDDSILGKRIVLAGYDYEPIENNGELLYGSREDNILMLIDADFKGTIE